MDIALQLDDQVREKLKDQELTLQYINEDEIQIMGNPRRQILTKLIFTLSGIVITAFSMIFAQGEGIQSLVVMIIGSIIGLGLIIMPFYNFYSKKQFRVLISRRDKTVIARSLKGVKSYTFDEIQNVMIKSFKMDDYVSDETSGSTTFHCKFYLKLDNNREAPLFTFSARERANIEKFSEAYGQFLAEFINKPLDRVQES